MNFFLNLNKKWNKYEEKRLIFFVFSLIRVSIITSWEKGNARFTTVPFKILIINRGLKSPFILIFSSPKSVSLNLNPGLKSWNPAFSLFVY